MEMKKKKIIVIRHPSKEATLIDAGDKDTITLNTSTDKYITIHIDPWIGKEESRYILYPGHLDGHIGYGWKWPFPINTPHHGPYYNNSVGRRLNLKKKGGLQRDWILVIAKDKLPEGYKTFDPPQKNSGISPIKTGPKNVEVGDENQDPGITENNGEN